MNNNIAFVLHF